MSQLGAYIKHLRAEHDRSRRWVEKRSRELYPQDRERHISHSYLRQIEEGMRDRPNPLKLQTLAEIYGVEYSVLLAVAGYLESQTAAPQPGVEVAGEPVEGGAKPESRLEAARRLIEWLEKRGIHSEYFMNSIMGLSEESLHIVNRLITTLSVQERQLRTKQTGPQTRPTEKS
jgi:transcriptional regulator with XRE-family HTH domain